MSARGHSGQGILIIEDDFDIRDMLSLVLESEGYRVNGVANGQEALQYLQGAVPPCLILLDLMMPVMNGWEFRERQKLDPTLASIPVVIISADGNLQEKAVSIDAVGYFKKPIEFGALLDTVKHYC